MVLKALKADAPIGIIAAMDAELKLYLLEMEELQTERVFGVEFFIGTIDGCEVVACVCGVGKVNSAYTATLMIQHYGVRAVINTGVAGGIGHKTLDVVIADNAVEYDSDYTAFGSPLGYVENVGVNIPADKDLVSALKSVLPKAYVGTIASGDRFVNDTATTDLLKNVFSAQAVDCETASIFHVAFRMKVPVVALRVISDGADDGATLSFAELKVKASDIAAVAVINCLQLMRK